MKNVSYKGFIWLSFPKVKALFYILTYLDRGGKRMVYNKLVFSSCLYRVRVSRFLNSTASEKDTFCCQKMLSFLENDG